MTAVLDRRVTGPSAMVVPAPQVPRSVNPFVRWTFYLYLCSIPFELPQRPIPIPLEIPTLFGFLFLFTSVLDLRACYGVVGPAQRWFAVYLWMFVVSALIHVGPYQGEILRLLINMLQVALLFWAGSGLFRDSAIRHHALRLFGLACVARAAVQVSGIAATAHQVWTGGERVTAFGQNANLSAMILSAGAMAILGLRLAQRPLWRPGITAWPAVLLIGLAITQTGSRGGILGLGLGAAAFLFRGGSMLARSRNITVACLALGGLLYGARNSTLLRNRFAAAETGQLAGREEMYPILWDMFREKPLLGWGPIANQFELAKRLGNPKFERRDAHNIVFELVTTTGVIGAIPFLIGLGLCIRNGWRARRGPDRMLAFALLLPILEGILSGTWIASKILWLALAQADAAGRTHAEAELACAV